MTFCNLMQRKQTKKQYHGLHLFPLYRFAAIKTHSPYKPVLIFVSSRRQTRLTALDLIAFLAAEDKPKQWLHMPEEDVSILQNTKARG